MKEIVDCGYCQVQLDSQVVLSLSQAGPTIQLTDKILKSVSTVHGEVGGWGEDETKKKQGFEHDRVIDLWNYASSAEQRHAE